MELTQNEVESFTDTISSKADDSFKLEVDIRDEKYIHKLKTTLAGVPPPPKFTIPQFSAAEMLNMYNKNVGESTSYLKSVERTEDKLISEEMTALQFPEAMKCLYYGIHYNRGDSSVEYEFLSNKYQQRYVGSETSSTVIDKSSSSQQDSLTASAKKKARKNPWNHSPGRRLSHLARRRQIFTSASLPRAAVGNRIKANVMDSRRMIMLDSRKSTQSQSSARSRLASLTLSSQPSTSSSFSQMPKLQAQSSHSQMPSKRALFQSPDCFSRENAKQEKETPRTDKNKARRALFSSGSKMERMTPNKKTPNKKTPNKKTPNKRTPKQGGRRTPHKGTPTSSRKKTPRKSLFSDPDDNRFLSRDLFNVNGKRPRSESLLNLHGETSVTSAITLSSDEKKKLLWVVYHCLKERKINSRNTLYRPCQNSLYRLCSDDWKAYLAQQPAKTKITNVSEKLLNIARKHVSGVILKVKNNQSFYRVTAPPKDNSSESGDTCITDTKSHLEPCSQVDDRSDVDSIVKSDFDKESICVKSDIDSTYAKSECSIKRGSSSSCMQSEESNTRDSAFFMPDSLMSDTNTTSSFPIGTETNSNHAGTDISSNPIGSEMTSTDPIAFGNHSSSSLLSIAPDSKPSDTICTSSSPIEPDSSPPVYYTPRRKTRSCTNNSKSNKDVSKDSPLELEVVESSSVAAETNDSSLVCNTDSASMFTSPFLTNAKNCKVVIDDIPNKRSLLHSMSSDVRKVLEIKGVPNSRKMLGDLNNRPKEGKLPLGDLTSMYDEDTRF